MTGASHGGKGDDRRPSATPDAYAKGFDGIDWTKTRDRGSQAVVDTAQTRLRDALDRAKDRQK